VQQKIAAYRQQAYAQSYPTFLPDAPEAQVVTRFAGGFAFDMCFDETPRPLIGEVRAPGPESTHVRPRDATVPIHGQFTSRQARKTIARCYPQQSTE
jgi:hypothetical protein